MTYVVPTLTVGGAERQLVRLVNSLDRRCFQPRIICLGPDDALREEIAPDVPVRFIRLKGMGHHRALLRLGRAFWMIVDLAVHKPHILHGYLPAAYVLGALMARLLRVRAVVATRMTVISIEHFPQPILRLLARRANQAIDTHVCDSEACRTMAVRTERLDRARTVVIHSGSALPDLPLPQPAFPPAWGVGESEYAAVNIANLKWEKAQHVLVEAVERVVRVFPRFTMVLVGEGPRRGALEAMVGTRRLAANVAIVGSVPDAARFLARFRFSVLSSVTESFPNVLVESMAAGVPVVATRVGGVPELMRDGVDGFIVPPNEPEALAEAMLKMLSKPDLRDRMGAAGRARVRDRFSLEQMVENTERLYLSLVGGPSDGGRAGV